MGGARKKEFLDIFGRNEIEANKWLLRGVEAMILVNQRVKSNCFKYQDDECIFAKVQGGISIENPVIVGPKFFMPRLKDTIPRYPLYVMSFHI